jgi:hypothetical protein
MLILPLDHPEPFAATLGVMLYPGTDQEDQSKARSFTAHWLAEPLERFHNAGHQLSYDRLARIAMDAGAVLTDLEGRWRGGTVTGELFKVLHILATNDPALASWENAHRIYDCAAGTRSGGSRTSLYKERSRFRSVAHLWGAWSIREGKFRGRPELGYDGWDDFQSFLTEAEQLRKFGQEWSAARAKSSPPLPPEVWRVPSDWNPPERRPGWPDTGMIPDLKLPDDLMTAAKRPGRPRTAGYTYPLFCG